MKPVFALDQASRMDPKSEIRIQAAPMKAVSQSAAIEMGKRVKVMRDALELSQADIARQMNLSDAAISMWEKGKTSPSLDKFIELAKILHTTPEYLAFGVMYTGHKR